MTRRTQLFAIAVVILCSAVGAAASDQDTQSSLHIKVALTKAVASGMTIDEAVTKTIEQDSQDSGQTVAAAFSILKQLPKRACATRSKDGSMRLAAPVDYKKCGDRIVRSAIAAGADPTSISQATAAGFPSESPDPTPAAGASEGPNRKVCPIELFVRKLFLYQSMNGAAN